MNDAQIKAANDCELLVQEAHKHGLPEEQYIESRFCLWVGNEVFENREFASFTVLIARAKELVQMFLAQDRISSK